jgi:DNA invertase Pin-like site-specific DNA recombinase
MTNHKLATLEKMLYLIRQRENLLSQINQIDRKLDGLQTSSAIIAEVIPAKVKRQKDRRKGKTQNLVFSALKAGASKGLSVAEIAKKTKIHPPTLRVWIYTSGKKLGLRKIAPGRFALPT